MEELVVAYARSSKKRGDTIDNQLLLLKEMARPWEGRKLWIRTEEGVSGMTTHRPALEEILHLTKSYQVILLVKDFSRIGRNYLECYSFLQEFQKRGGRICSYAEQYDSQKQTVPQEELLLYLLLYEEYSLDLSVKITASLESLRLEKGYLFAYPPYGFERTERGLQKKEALWPVVETIRKMRRQGKTYKEIAKACNDRQLPSPGKQKYLDSGTEKFQRYANAKWSAQAVRMIATHPLYEGEYLFSPGAYSKKRVKGRLGESRKKDLYVYKNLQ